MKHWYEVDDADELVSPCLLVYPDRIANNIQTMVRIAGNPKRLRPHIKTHKMAEIIAMQRDKGIDAFKCATIAEAELLAQTGAKEVLLAIQPVGPNISRFLTLMEAYPETEFSTIVDNKHTVQTLSQRAKDRKLVVGLWLDINTGMHRTGIQPDAHALDVYQLMDVTAHIDPKGFHVYDGHIRDTDIAVRTQKCNRAFEAVRALKAQLEALGIGVPTIIAGGTPSFPVHAKRPDVDLSPGTSLLWDHRYGTLFPDMIFDHAAVLLTRIISKPAAGYLCLDLGHKSVAPEMPLPRVHFLGDNDFKQVGQSEEHLVVTTEQSERYAVGDVLYAIPYHICPTVAKYHEVIAIKDRKKYAVWSVAARNNKITI